MLPTKRHFIHFKFHTQMYNCTLVYKMTHFQSSIVPNRLLKNSDPKTTSFLKHSIEILKSLYSTRLYFCYVLNILWLSAVTMTIIPCLITSDYKRLRFCGWNLSKHSCYAILPVFWQLKTNDFFIFISLFQSQAGQLVFFLIIRYLSPRKWGFY